MAPYYHPSDAPEKIREYRQGALVWDMRTWVKRFKVEKILKKGLKFCNIHRKIPVLESLFLQVYITKFLRAPILRNICGRLLLKVNSKDTLNPFCNSELL